MHLILLFLICQAFAFLKRYEEYRGVCQETCYNIGRALHQIGMKLMFCVFYTDPPDTRHASWSHGANYNGSQLW